MSKDNNSSHFLMGFVMGAILGVLVAPQSGKKTRTQLKAKAENIWEKAEPKYDELVVKLQPLLEALSEAGEPYKEELMDKVEGFAKKKLGKKAFEEIKQLYS